ncbi:DNA-binding transcriptional LysR family regulator [Thermocatellispora tengchongensis]|uniref:DNA-binding transcriptional LysR family regulator n=1 Tax=Thermocatellispora tengchongensis TaxID=1073253 RepID=A0A840P067_9ACTN|nr:LysR family transcriptional regulator [Thermocatellispora tengchongensis]MBB5131333.1 DNA-binding transcriptional LysR family regulator [Thermocatellispora tengchongensis]
MTYESDSADPHERVAARLAPGLALLAAIRETQHVTRAAELLGVPQPTVSRRLAALGETVGTPLVVPDGRGVRLTRAGHLVADAAARALTVLAAGAREAHEEIDPESGRVVLGFLHLLGRSLVPSLVRGYRERNPRARFTLVQGARDEMLHRLAAGELDLVLVAPPPPPGDPALAAAPLARQELVVTLPASHPLAGRATIAAAELAGEDLVTLERGYGLRQITDELCAAAGFRPRIAFEGQETETIRGLVTAGLGVALLPRSSPPPDPALVAEIPMSPPVFRTIGLCWRAAERLTPAVRACRDFILAESPDLAPEFLPLGPRPSPALVPDGMAPDEEDEK